MGYIRYSQSFNLTKTGRNKKAKSLITQSAVKIAEEKDMSCLKDDTLDSGKQLLINVFQLVIKKALNANLRSIF